LRPPAIQSSLVFRVRVGPLTQLVSVTGYCCADRDVSHFLRKKVALDKSEEIPDRSRREFLKQVGGALGGLAITGGLGANAGAQGAIPSGYKFYRVLTANDGSNPVQSLSAAVMIGGFNSPGKNQTDVIYFHGTTTAQFRSGNPSALFLANINYQGTRPTINSLEVVVALGDKLESVVGVDRAQLPIVVGTLGTGSANSLGNYATAIAVEDFGQAPNGSVEVKSSPGVYLFEPLTHTWTKRARFGDTAPDGSKYGGIFGDVVLNDDNSVTLVAATTAQPNLPLSSASSASRGSRFSGLVGSHALIEVAPPGSDDSFIVLKSGDLLPGTSAMVESFGIIDVVQADYFVAQVTARRLEVRGGLAGTGVVRGRLTEARLNQRDGLGLLSASSHLLPESMIRADAVLLGESVIGPRVGAGGRTALVTHNPTSIPGVGSFDVQRLTLFNANGRRSDVAVAGDLSNVYNVAAFSAPVVSSESQLTYQAEALPDGTTRLFVDDGSTTVTILRSGDMVEGRKITEIHHGYHSAQVDVAGRLAFAAEFLIDSTADPTNPNNIFSSIVIGIPA
jgi:hypothetical protein